jgi:hypothetical protein
MSQQNDATIGKLVAADGSEVEVRDVKEIREIPTSHLVNR